MALWLGAGLIGFAVATGRVAAFDAWGALAIGGPARAAGWPVPLLLWATAIGGGAVRLPIAAAAAIALGWRRDWTAVLVLASATIGMLIGNAGLKLLVGRQRPDLLPHLAGETSLSFPSGHAANGAAVFGAIAWALVRSGVPAATVWPATLLLIAAIGTSRVVLGVHWPTDVIAGWCVGGGWMLTCVWLVRTGSRSAERR